MTDASAFDKLVVTDTLYVDAKLIVNGTVQAKKAQTGELCVDDVCVTREQFLKMVQGVGTSAPPAGPTFSPEPTQLPDPAPESPASTQ